MTIRDATGYDQTQKWYVECKLYSSSIDWPTVWNKISYADVQNADVLFLVTNSNPSPNCESKISEWNASRRRPAIRVWRGYDLPKILRSNQGIAVAHGLVSASGQSESGVIDLAQLISRLVQSAYAARIFGQEPLFALEAASALSELMAHRLSDLKEFGRFVPGPRVVCEPEYTWISVAGDASDWEDVSFRSLVTFVHHASQAKQMHVDVLEKRAYVKLIGRRDLGDIRDSIGMNTVLMSCLIEAEMSIEADSIPFVCRN